MSLNKAVNQHFDNCANNKQEAEEEQQQKKKKQQQQQQQQQSCSTTPGITPSSSYHFAIYNSAAAAATAPTKWSISPSNNPIPLSKSPSPISSLTDGDSGNGGGGSGCSSGTGSGTGAISWGSTNVTCSISGSGTTTASTCQRSSVITTCSSSAASSSASISASFSAKHNVTSSKCSSSKAKTPDGEAVKKSSSGNSPTTAAKSRKTIKFADSAPPAAAPTTTCSNDTASGAANGIKISADSSSSCTTPSYGYTVVVNSSENAMSAHQNNTSSSTVHTPTGTKPPSSPVKHHHHHGHHHGGGISGSKGSKSRHSSTSDSTCVTPTGSSAGVGLSGANSTHGTTVGPDGIDKQQIRVTRKIFNNWRSACGRTKDKTKDFIRRWKTLPENQSECETGDSGEQQQQQQQHSSLPCASSGNVAAVQGGGMFGNSHSLDQSGGIGSGASGGGGMSASINNTNTGAVSGGGGGGGADLSSSATATVTKPSSGFGKIRSLTKKFSQDIPSEDVSTSSISQTKPSAGWSVHVWATYVQRGQDDDDALSTKEEEKPGRDLLTDFQKTKLTHFFRHVLDMNHDDVISAADFVALNQRIRHYIEWSPECIEFHVLKEVHSGFLECFLNQPLDDCSVMYYCDNEKETRDHVNLDEWLDVWGKLLESARTLDDLPLWLQYFPKILFQVINKSGSQKISKEELRAFYTMFLGIDFRVVNETLDSIYNAMTDGGRNLITYCLFKLCFANFLLGRYPHGPGQYMFGICSPQSLHCNFPIDYSALNTPTDDLKPYDPSKDRDHSRRSVIV